MNSVNPTETIAMLETLITVVLEKSAEIIFTLLLEKFYKWILTDKNIKHSSKYIKTKILAIYLQWIFLKSSPKSLPQQDERK